MLPCLQLLLLLLQCSPCCSRSRCISSANWKISSTAWPTWGGSPALGPCCGAPSPAPSSARTSHGLRPGLKRLS